MKYNMDEKTLEIEIQELICPWDLEKVNSSIEALTPRWTIIHLNGFTNVTHESCNGISEEEVKGLVHLYRPDLEDDMEWC